MAGRSGETAETLILVGLILQAITVLILFVVGFALSFIPFIGGLVLLFAFFGLIFVILVYAFSYARTKEGDYEGARTPTLVFGILSLISLGLISGILYIVAYVKLGDAADEENQPGRIGGVLYGGMPQQPTPPTFSPVHTSGTGYAATPPSAPSYLPGAFFCTNCGQPALPQARFCRNCGNRLQ